MENASASCADTVGDSCGDLTRAPHAPEYIPCAEHHVRLSFGPHDIEDEVQVEQIVGDEEDPQEVCAERTLDIGDGRGDLPRAP